MIHCDAKSFLKGDQYNRYRSQPVYQRYHQMMHFDSGFMGLPAGQLNAFAKVSEFCMTPLTRTLAGECGSEKICHDA